LITFVEWAMPAKASFWQQREQYFHVTGGHDTRDKQLTQLQFPVRQAHWQGSAMRILRLQRAMAMEHRIAG
jgi:hypothetical protein